MSTEKNYTSVKKLQEAIDKFFDQRIKDKEPLTITWLALALGFTSRRALLNYEKVEWYEKYFHTIKKAKLFIEDYNEKTLYKWGNTVWVIFNLKNNFNRKDKQEVEQTQTNINIDSKDLNDMTTAELEELRRKILDN